MKYVLTPITVLSCEKTREIIMADAADDDNESSEKETAEKRGKKSAHYGVFS